MSLVVPFEMFGSTPGGGSGGGGWPIWDFVGPLVTGQRSDILGFPRSASFEELAATLTITGTSDTTVTPIHNGVSLTPFVVLHTQVVTLVPFVITFLQGDTLQYLISGAGALASGLVLALG